MQTRSPEGTQAPWVSKETDTDIGTLLLMLGLSYGLGLLFYDLLPGMLPERIWRVAAYPFLGIWIAEALLPSRILTFDPSFGGIHLLTALIGALVAVIVDWAITRARHPSVAPQFYEPRRTAEVHAQ